MNNKKDFTNSWNSVSNDLYALLGADKSGFFDLDEIPQCKHPEHEPPMYLYIPTGKGYRHVCPKCGKVTTIISPQISF